jgi:branched-chain amino acid transport system substrate-binding protein
MRAIAALVVAGLLASLMAARGDARHGAAQTRKEVVVGAILDLASGWTSLGRGSRVTMQLAAADANAAFARSHSSVRVRLRIVDAKGEPSLALREFRDLAASGVRVVVGPEKSSEVAAVRGAATRAGVIVISQGSTAHSLAISGDNVLRFVPDDIREGEALVALLGHDKVDAIVPVWRQDAGNEGLARSVRRQFAAKGGKVAPGVPYADKTTNFTGVATSIAAQAGALRAAGAARVGVYLAGFDEVVDLFHAARATPTLRSYPWFGSDGVALSTRLANDEPAAAFADVVGYPNPTVGLSAAAVRKARPVVARARKKLGRAPDALALTAYDALRIAAQGEQRAGGRGGARLRRAIVAAANSHDGITGRMTLNRAGDRAYGSFDFWSVCARGAKFGWVRTFEYEASRVGSGRILVRSRC